MVDYKARLARPGDVQASALFLVPAMLSMLGDLFIALTLLLFPDLRKFRHSNIILYMAICGFFGTLGAALGPVPTGSPACWFQGIAGNACFAVSAAWMSVYAQDLYSAVHRGTIMTDAQFLRVHLAVWTIVPLCSLLPLIRMTYGNSSQLDQWSWCFITMFTDDDYRGPNSAANTARAAKSASDVAVDVILGFIAFYGWIFGSMVFCLGVSISILIKTSKYKRYAEIRMSIMRMLWYPSIISICWVPSAIIDIRTAINPPNKNTFTVDAENLMVVAPIIQNFFLGLAFLLLTPIAQQHWWRLLQRWSENLREKMWGASSMLSMSGKLQVEVDMECAVRPSIAAHRRETDSFEAIIHLLTVVNADQKNNNNHPLPGSLLTRPSPAHERRIADEACLQLEAVEAQEEVISPLVIVDTIPQLSPLAQNSAQHRTSQRPRSVGLYAVYEREGVVSWSENSVAVRGKSSRQLPTHEAAASNNAGTDNTGL